jgi:hypothetical protein
MDLIIGAVVSVIIQALKSKLGGSFGVIGMVVLLSFACARGYVYLVDAGYWDAFARVLTTAGAFYTASSSGSSRPRNWPLSALLGTCAPPQRSGRNDLKGATMTHSNDNKNYGARNRREGISGSVLFAIGIAIAAFLGILMYSFSENDRPITGSTSSTATTGQSQSKEPRAFPSPTPQSK